MLSPFFNYRRCGTDQLITVRSFFLVGGCLFVWCFAFGFCWLFVLLFVLFAFFCWHRDSQQDDVLEQKALTPE